VVAVYQRMPVVLTPTVPQYVAVLDRWVVIAALGVPVNVVSAVLLCCGGSLNVAHAHSHGADGGVHAHGGGTNVNMLAVLLHTLGDAFTSIMVTFSAGIILVSRAIHLGIGPY
jgi:Co/Zn/Cd efflux system component